MPIFFSWLNEKIVLSLNAVRDRASQKDGGLKWITVIEQGMMLEPAFWQVDLPLPVPWQAFAPATSLGRPLLIIINSAVIGCGQASAYAISVAAYWLLESIILLLIGNLVEWHHLFLWSIWVSWLTSWCCSYSTVLPMPRCSITSLVPTVPQKKPVKAGSIKQKLDV